MLGLYKMFIGSKALFLSPYGEEGQEEMYQKALAFWNKLDSVSLWFPLVFILVGGGIAAYYYSWFNNQPGRHYMPKYWYIMLALCAVVGFSISLAVPMFFVGTSFGGSLGLESKLAFGNMCYTALFYLIVSFIWCRCFKTNAYKMF